jgi:Ca2+-binding EF-hand superfamily protein
VHNVEAEIVLKERNLPANFEEASSQVMKVFEQNESGTINKQDLKSALKEVCESNGKQMSPAQTNALSDKIFKQADSQKTGEVSRAQMREALEDNLLDLQSIEKVILPPSSQAMANKVLQAVQSSQSGIVTKQDLKKALKDIAKTSGKVLSTTEANGVVDKIFSAAETSAAGEINRS